jgi:hypothetical protein
MTRKVIAALAIAACGLIMFSTCSREPPPEATIRVREVLPLDGTSIEVLIDERADKIVVSRMKALIRTEVTHPPVETNLKLRRLFYRTLRQQPAARGTSPPLDGITFEIIVKTPERTWQATIRGPLTGGEYEAFDLLNTTLPPDYVFDIDFGQRRRAGAPARRAR